MLNIQIDDQELEQDIRNTYGDDKKSLAKAFLEFIKQQKIKQDIGISIKQLDAGDGIPLADTISDICAEYE